MNTQSAKYEAARDKGVYHLFEKAGLGEAPFKVIARHWSALVSSCDYCGHPIMEICVIEDRRRRTFKVGNVCIEKTGDEGLIQELRRLRRAAKGKKDLARIETAKAQLELVGDALSAQPHPFDYLSRQGKTLLDYIEWLLEHGGMAGQLRAAKMIEQTPGGTVACELRRGWLLVYSLSAN